MWKFEAQLLLVIMIWINLYYTTWGYFHITAFMAVMFLSKEFDDPLLLWPTLFQGSMIWTNLNVPYLRISPYKFQLFWLVEKDDYYSFTLYISIQKLKQPVLPYLTSGNNDFKKTWIYHTWGWFHTNFCYFGWPFPQKMLSMYSYVSKAIPIWRNCGPNTWNHNLNKIESTLAEDASQ